MVTEPRDDSEVQSLIIGRGVSGVQRVEGVRGRAAKVLHRGLSGTVLDVDIYVDELASRGYQLHECLHAGLSSQVYRASRMQQQPLDITSSSQLTTEDEVCNMPVKCALDLHDVSASQAVKSRLCEPWSEVDAIYMQFILTTRDVAWYIIWIVYVCQSVRR